MYWIEEVIYNETIKAHVYKFNFFDINPKTRTLGICTMYTKKPNDFLELYLKIKRL